MKNIKTILLIFSGLIILGLITSGVSPRETPTPILIPIDTSSDQFTVELVKGTSYNPEIGQTDSTPLATADGSKIDTSRINELRWCAVSQDLLKQFGGKFTYGDTIYVYPMQYNDDNKYLRRITGKWIIHDTMNARMKKMMDFLSSSEHIRGSFDKLIIIKLNY